MSRYDRTQTSRPLKPHPPGELLSPEGVARIKSDLDLRAHSVGAHQQRVLQHSPGKTAQGAQVVVQTHSPTTQISSAIFVTCATSTPPVESEPVSQLVESSRVWFAAPSAIRPRSVHASWIPTLGASQTSVLPESINPSAVGI